MGEIKTDMFPEVLRMKARNKQDNARENDREGAQSNVVIPAEALAESLKQGKGRRIE